MGLCAVLCRSIKWPHSPVGHLLSAQITFGRDLLFKLCAKWSPLATTVASWKRVARSRIAHQSQSVVRWMDGWWRVRPVGCCMVSLIDVFIAFYSQKRVFFSFAFVIVLQSLRCRCRCRRRRRLRFRGAFCCWFSAFSFRSTKFRDHFLAIIMETAETDWFNEKLSIFHAFVWWRSTFPLKCASLPLLSQHPATTSANWIIDRRNEIVLARSKCTSRLLCHF